MGMTLEELAASNKKAMTTTEPTIEPTETVTEETEVAPEEPNINSGFKHAKLISTDILGKNLEKEHPEEAAAKHKPAVDAPLVKDAFDNLTATIDKKKAMADARLEAAKEYAENKAIERETGLTDEELNKSSDSIDNLDDISDEIEKDLNGDSEEDAVKPIENVEQPTAPQSAPQEVEYKVEDTVAPKEKVEIKHETKPVEVEEEAEDNDQGELDDLLKDIDAEDEKFNVEADEETPEEMRARFKESMDSVVVTKNPLDLSKFNISTVPVASSSILNIQHQSSIEKKADWPLYHTKRNMTFTAALGPELDNLRKTVQNSNPVNGVVASIKFVYNHIIDANKPPFEVWCKLIRTEDIESLYYGVYLATYSDSNLLARNCEDGCKRTSLIDTDVYSMVKYADDTVKDEMSKLRELDSTTDDRKSKQILIQISDRYALSYTGATLYSTFIQYATLNKNITDKYSDILNTMAYIDNFFEIDAEKQELHPVAVRNFPNNLNKAVLSKLKVYTDILKTLTSDQYNILIGKLSNLIQEPKVTYVYPKTVCPECNKEIPEAPVESMINVLFTRAQLAQIKNL